MTQLIYSFGLRGSDVHVVGHSLGAHLVGKLARVFEEETGQKVARVTGTGYRVKGTEYKVQSGKQTSTAPWGP